MIKIGNDVVFKWLGTEYIGVLTNIITQNGIKQYMVEHENTTYRCYDTSRFGFILLNKTEDLQNNKYVKVIKSDADIMIEEIEVMLQELKDLNELDYPKRKMKEFKFLIVNLKKKLSKLQKEVLSK